MVIGVCGLEIETIFEEGGRKSSSISFVFLWDRIAINSI